MESRTKMSFFNITSNFSIIFLKSILSFVTRTFFIKYLGETALGLNGLFTNILLMLSLAELGISSAINFSLYKPLANKDSKKVSILMSFYKKVYVIVGVTVFCVGIILIPFLPLFIKNIHEIDGIYVIYILYLLNTASSYFIAYRETLITADQKAYKLTKINIIWLIILNFTQILVLILTKSFILYLVVQFIVQFIQRVIINIYIGKVYEYIDFNLNEKLPKNTKDEIVKNVKALFFHKIGDWCINGTDNLIISAFINVGTVGIYSNYLMVINLLNNFISNIFNSITSSLGNLVVKESDETKDRIFKIMNFTGFILYGFCSVCLINVLDPFIELWIGKKYCLDWATTMIIIINFYMTGMRAPVHSMKSAAGLYDVDKYTPLLQSVINLTVSIICVHFFGLFGVLLGTLLSSIAIPCWQRPYLVYKYVIHKTSRYYFIEYFKYVMIVLGSSSISYCCLKLVIFQNIFLKFIISGLFSGLIFIIIVICMYRNSSEFSYLLNLVRRRL